MTKILDFLQSKEGKHFFEFVFALLFSILLVYAFWHYKKLRTTREDFYMGIAFHLLDDAGSELGNSVYLNSGERKTLSDIVTGKIHGFETYIYNCTIANELPLYDDNGPVELSARITVFEVLLEKQNPSMILLSKMFNAQKQYLRKRFNLYRTTVLEGNFSNYYELFTKESELGDALTILTPDIMEQLIQASGIYDIEVNGDRLLVFLNIPESTHKLRDMYQFTKTILSTLPK